MCACVRVCVGKRERKKSFEGLFPSSPLWQLTLNPPSTLKPCSIYTLWIFTITARIKSFFLLFKFKFFFIQPSYPPSWAFLLFSASQCGGLPSSLSGSVPAIIWTLCCRPGWGISYRCVFWLLVIDIVIPSGIQTAGAESRLLWSEHSTPKPPSPVF